MATPSTPSALHALFIFNPDLGEEATEARKLLYFFDNRPETVAKLEGGQPNFVDLNYQKDLCGIAEGLIAFTRDFSPETLCESVHCQQHRYAFAQPEKGYWMVLVVKNPTIVHKSDSSKKDAPPPTTEYMEEELEDSVLQAILHRCYSLYSLFNSSFTSLSALSGADALRCSLSLFMSYFLPTIRFSQLVYFTDIHGFQFLPVDKITFLTIQYIMHLLTGNFQPPTTVTGSSAAAAAAAGLPSSSAAAIPGLVGPSGVIKNVALMYNAKLIYSGLHSELMFLLYSLDQDPMYFFLSDYLARKENMHVDIQRWRLAKAAAAAGGQQEEAETTKAWEVSAPAPLPGIWNVPESPYERNGRVASNRKAFDRAQNKGTVAAEEEFEEEDETKDFTTPVIANLGVREGTASGAVGAAANETTTSRTNSGGPAVVVAPFGYMTGPLRVSSSPLLVSSGAGTSAASASATAAAQAAALAATLPGAHVASTAPCPNSPLIYLDNPDALPQARSAGSPAGAQPVKGGPYGSGNPALENHPALNAFSNPAAAASSGADATTAAKAASRPLRLVVYQKFKITLFLIVEDEEVRSSSVPSADAASAAVAIQSTPQPQPQPQPALSFYTSLEAFMESNLKKLGELLLDQSMRMGGGGGGGQQGSSGSSSKESSSSNAAAAAAAAADEPYRFLYFNHMNLALKTSLSSTSSPHASKHSSSSSAGTVLTMDTIKLIREMHKDFNTPSFKNKQVAAQHAADGVLPPPLPPPHIRHSISSEGASEICVKTKSHGWVIGKRASQSHREFFLLLEEKVGSLADIQGNTHTHRQTEREMQRVCARA